MLECFNEPLSNINELRGKLDLSEIKVKEFNEYLNYDFLDEVKKHFSLKEEVNFESFYYFFLCF